MGEWKWEREEGLLFIFLSFREFKKETKILLYIYMNSKAILPWCIFPEETNQIILNETKFYRIHQIYSSMSKKDNVNVFQFSIFKRIQIKVIGKSKQKKFCK